MHQAPGEAVQKVCPRCSTLAYTGDRHCPWCGGSYRRRLWPALLVTGLVTALLTLGGTTFLALQAGEDAEAKLDEEVSRVERELDRSFSEIQEGVRSELDARLPPVP